MHLESILLTTVCDNKDMLGTKGYVVRTTAKVWPDGLAQPTLCFAYVLVIESQIRRNQTTSDRRSKRALSDCDFWIPLHS